MKRWIAALVLCLAVTNVGRTHPDSVQIDVTAGKAAFAGPLCIPLSVPAAAAKLDEVTVEIKTDDGAGKLVGQLTAPGITTESIKAAGDAIRRDLHVIMPPLGASKTCTLTVHLKKTGPQVVRFAWTEKPGEFEELILTRSGTSTPYLRYMNRPYDTSSKDAREKSYKVFHHLYDPTGKRLITNGGYADGKGATTEKLLYPHHRGIMYGFNKCTYGPDLKKKADTWHCTGDAHVAHVKTLRAEPGPVLGRHRVQLSWHGEKNEVFAEEERELTAYNVDGGTLIEFASRLRPVGARVRLDGDPQHAGFQFRAHNNVSGKAAKQTYYLHPDGKGDLGATRNWDPKKGGPVDLPWYTLSFVLDQNRYSVCYLNHPRNPSPTRFSERDYGRFGGYFEADVTPERPLVVNYRLWMQMGDMTADQAQALRAAFAAPANTKVRAN